MRLSLEFAWLIEGAEADGFDEQMAGKWLESVAAEFHGLPDDAKLRLIDVARELAAEYRDDGYSVGADFFDRSPEAFGFGSPSADAEG
jgi:hypothetical protein